MNSKWFRIGVPVLLAVLAIAGAWLLLSGSGDDAGSPPDEGDDGPHRLVIGGTDQESVSALAALALPENTADFLTARLDDDSQLDITFTLDPAEEEQFLSDSGLPEPVASERVIYHSSPLWKLNAEGTIRGADDTHDDVRRSVEFIGEQGRTRVRIVITPLG